MKTQSESIRERCQNYHEKHPHVWRLFQQFAFEKIELGYKHYSSKSIFERIRWEHDTGPKTEKFAISNDYTPYYARKFHRKYPDYDGFFRTKSLPSEQRYAA